MSARVCDDCGETCFGCDNQDDPHYCPVCRARSMQVTTLMVEVPLSMLKDLDSFGESLELAL